MMEKRKWPNFRLIGLSSQVRQSVKVSLKQSTHRLKFDGKKVKFSHTHYRALGPELISVYRQSACRWLFKSSPGSRLPLFFFQACSHLPSRRMSPFYDQYQVTQLPKLLCSFVRVWIEPTTYWSHVQRLNHYATAPELLLSVMATK